MFFWCYSVSQLFVYSCYSAAVVGWGCFGVGLLHAFLGGGGLVGCWGWGDECYDMLLLTFVGLFVVN